MPDKVPLWIIRNTFCPYGSRMDQRPDSLGTDLKVCTTCQKEMYSYKDWHWCDQLYYCGDCIGAARRAETAARALKYGRSIVPINQSRMWRDDVDDRIGFDYMESGMLRVPKTEADIPNGNLNENDYAFWIGNLEAYSGGTKSLRSVCRACSQICFGDTGRTGHKVTSTNFYKDKLSCAKVLMLSYQQLLKQDYCLVCNNKCHGKQKWGVPLCCPNCIKVWKFTEDLEYEPLERTMMQYWVALETKPETGGLSISGSSSSQTQTVLPAEEGEEE